MADSAPTSSGSLTRSPSNAEIDTSAPFASVRAARSMFETDGEKGKAPMPAVGRTGSVRSGDYLSKPQGLSRSRENSLDESKPRANTIASPNSATSEYRGFQSPPNQRNEKLEADLKDARAQLEDTQARLAAEMAARREEGTKRVALDQELAEYQAAAQRFQQDLAREQAANKQAQESIASEQAAKKQAQEALAEEQAAHKQAQESADAASMESRKLQAALEKEKKDHADKNVQVQAALSAMQTTNEAHDETQAQLSASKEALRAVQNSLALTEKKAADAADRARRQEAALREALAVSDTKAKDALAGLKLAREAEETAKKEAAVAVEGEGKARTELARALSEAELAKKATATLESKLEAALKELELAQHAEELARKRAAEDQAVREKAVPATPLESKASGAYEAELATFQRRLAEAEELADKRVAAVTAQLDAVKRSEEETKAKLEALSTETTAAKDASTSQELQAALAEAERTKKALQAESDKVHDAGVNISIAQAKEKQALDRVAVLEQGKAALEARLSELKTKGTVAATTSNGSKPANEISSELAAESSGGLTARPQVKTKGTPQEAVSEPKKQPVCCVVT